MVTVYRNVSPVRSQYYTANKATIVDNFLVLKDSDDKVLAGLSLKKITSFTVNGLR